jgi:hypothetical protein
MNAAKTTPQLVAVGCAHSKGEPDVPTPKRKINVRFATFSPIKIEIKCLMKTFNPALPTPAVTTSADTQNPPGAKPDVANYSTVDRVAPGLTGLPRPGVTAQQPCSDEGQRRRDVTGGTGIRYWF